MTNSNVCHTITQVLDTIEEGTSLCHTNSLDYIRNQAAECLLRDNVIEEAHLIRDDTIHDNTTYRGLNHTLLDLTVNQVVNDYLNQSMEITTTLVTSDQSLLRTIDCQALTLCAWTNLSNIVKTKHHILRRNGDRRTIGRVQDVVAL